MSDKREPNSFASPPCFMHELDQLNEGADDRTEDVTRWRKAERERLIGARLAVDAQTRGVHTDVISRYLEAWIDDACDGDRTAITLSAYWPFRGEPNLHVWLKHFRSAGGRTALPVVVAKGAPLIFRLWADDTRLERGVWNIPVPADGEEVAPDIVIAPLVGFDREGYRLGYGGGFFDRTLAALPKRAKVIGVGYEASGIKTIYPQWHDVPMDAIATECEMRTFHR